MVDIPAFAKRIRRFTIAAAIVFFGSAFMLVVDYTTSLPTAEKGEFAFVWLFGLACSGYLYWRSLEMPQKEILQLAEERNGVLTLAEISTALNIHPALAARTLARLQTAGLARPCWQELDKNLWEFPDASHLPVTQTIQLAQQKKGTLTLQDLVAAGHSLEVAEQTFTVLAGEGIAHDEHSDGPRRLVFDGPQAQTEG